MPDSVTIGGLAIAFDYQCQIREFLRVRLPPDDVLFARWCPAPKMHAAVIDNYEAFTPPYQPLPSIELGELQWPSGLSRYARAIYLVDRLTMFAIAQAAWGYAGALNADDDVPSSWGIDQVAEVAVVIHGEETFQCSMLPLPPHRVPGAGADLWILPLVDRRFLMQQIPYEPDGYATNWGGLFEDLATTLNASIVWGGIDSEYGVPDPLTIKPGIQATALLDCAALSVGLRPVVDPVSGAVRLLNAADSDARCQATCAKSTIIAGGFRGRAVVPSSLSVFCRHAKEFSLVCGLQERRTADIDDGEPATYTQLAHSAWVVDERLFGSSLVKMNDAATNYYVEKVAADMATWFNGGGSYAFAGAINYAPSGYDDYLTIQTAEVAYKQYWFASRVYELPAVFLPNLLLSQTANIKVAAIVEQFTADDQESEEGEAYFPGSPSLRVFVNGLSPEHSGQTITAFYRCEIGWTKIASLGGGTTAGIELFVFTLTSDLAASPGATASATAAAANTIGSAAGAITVTNAGAYRAFGGATGLAAKLGASLYWILTVDQPALRVFVKLNEHPNSSGGNVKYGADPREDDAAFKSSPAPIALTPYPFSFLPDLSSGLVPNPLDLMGEDGDGAILEWNKNTDSYFLSEVYPQRQLELWATLADHRPNGLGATMSCEPETPIGIGAMPASPFDVKDSFNVAINARDNQRVLAKWDTKNAEYIAVLAAHRARRIKCTLDGDFYARPDTFDVVAIADGGMDGTTPSGTLEVANRYGWEAGSDGQEIEILWDTEAGQWYPDNIECPDDPTPTYF